VRRRRRLPVELASEVESPAEAATEPLFPRPRRLPGGGSVGVADLRVPAASAGFGPYEVGAERYQAEVLRVPGVHSWVLVAIYRVAPEQFLDGSGGSMDARTLLAFDGPSCYWCGKPYTPALARRYCRAAD
jgi:hypothetical protein